MCAAEPEVEEGMEEEDAPAEEADGPAGAATFDKEDGNHNGEGTSDDK